MSLVVRRSGNRRATPEGNRGPGRSPPLGPGEGEGRSPADEGYPRDSVIGEEPRGEDP